MTRTVEGIVILGRDRIGRLDADEVIAGVAGTAGIVFRLDRTDKQARIVGQILEQIHLFLVVRRGVDHPHRDWTRTHQISIDQGDVEENPRRDRKCARREGQDACAGAQGDRAVGRRNRHQSLVQLGHGESHIRPRRVRSILGRELDYDQVIGRDISECG